MSSGGRPKVAIPDAILEKMRSLYPRLSLRALGKRFKFNPRVISRELKAAGVQIPAYCHRRVPADIDNEKLLREYRNRSRRVSDLALKYNCSVSALQKHLASLGAYRRGPYCVGEIQMPPRNYACEGYDTCLTRAAKANQRDLGCKTCEQYHPVVRELPLTDMYGYFRLVAAVFSGDGRGNAAVSGDQHKPSEKRIYDKEGRLRRLRHHFRIRQTDMAARYGLNLNSYSGYERGVCSIAPELYARVMADYAEHEPYFDAPLPDTAQIRRINYENVERSQP